MVNTHETVASTVLDNSHDEEPLWEKILSLPGRGTFEHSAPDFFRPIFLAFSTTIISEQWLNFVDGYIIQPHVKSTIAAGPGFGHRSRDRSREAGRRKGGPALSSGLSYVSQNDKRKSLFSVPGRLPKSVLGRLPIHVTVSAIPRARPLRGAADHPSG